MTEPKNTPDTDLVQVPNNTPGKCLTCRHFLPVNNAPASVGPFGWCGKSYFSVPLNGSGYCHLHKGPAKSIEDFGDRNDHNAKREQYRACVENLWPVGDSRGEYDCFLGFSSNALGILDDILERFAGEKWSNQLIAEIQECRDDLDKAIDNGVRLHNIIVAMEHNERIARTNIDAGDVVTWKSQLDKVFRVRSLSQDAPLDPAATARIAPLDNSFEVSVPVSELRLIGLRPHNNIITITRQSSDKAVTHEG